jgi:putative membrane protein
VLCEARFDVERECRAPDAVRSLGKAGSLLMDMYGWGHGAMWIVWLVIGVVVVAALTQMFRGSGSPWRNDSQDRAFETARQVLDKRYARGEITKEQYEEMKRTLEG